jgi:hypothetical protein
MTSNKKEYMKQYNKKYHVETYVPKPKRERKFDKQQYMKQYMEQYSSEYEQRPEVKERRKQYNVNYTLTPAQRQKYLDKQNERYANDPSMCRKAVERHKQRYKSDPLYKAKSLVRTSLYKAMKRVGAVKRQATLDLVGVKDWAVLVEHLESKFQKGMTWNNWGVGKDNTTWHIDHIVPLNSATSEDEVKKLCHYTNLQPLWGSDNIRKSDSMCQQQPLGSGNII